jgi:predicted SPOUT superfamily RNA methylase MTH1
VRERKERKKETKIDARERSRVPVRERIAEEREQKERVQERTGQDSPGYDARECTRIQESIETLHLRSAAEIGFQKVCSLSDGQRVRSKSFLWPTARSSTMCDHERRSERPVGIQ